MKRQGQIKSKIVKKKKKKRGGGMGQRGKVREERGATCQTMNPIHSVPLRQIGTGSAF